MKMKKQQKNREFKGMNNKKFWMSLKQSRVTSSLCYGSVAASLGILLPEIALADFNLDEFGKSIADPAKKAFNDFYAVGILVAGGVGAFLHGQGDFRDRMLGFGKGAAIGGLVVGAVKAGFGL